MRGKAILIRDKRLAGWWNSISKNDDFASVATLALAELAEKGLPTEQIKGANALIDELMLFAENDPSSIPLPSPGLHHDFEKKPEKKSTDK